MDSLCRASPFLTFIQSRLYAIKLLAFSFFSLILSIVFLCKSKSSHARPSPVFRSIQEDEEEEECAVSSRKQKKKRRKLYFLFRNRAFNSHRRVLAHNLRTVNKDLKLNESFSSIWENQLFLNSRSQTLFTQSWIPSNGSNDMKGILVLLHGLNEHSGRYVQFALQLNSQGYGVYAMDWIGHGGSDGLHGYVSSLDHVVADTIAFLHWVSQKHPHIPCFLFGHSTGGAVALKAASYPSVEMILQGIILTSPALRVRPTHPIFKVLAPVFSVLIPTLQFKGANKRGIPVSRDPQQLQAKYSDPLVYTGPLRIRTGFEILRITSYLQRNLKSITVPFLVMHGTADLVTDPFASQDLYWHASSEHKSLKLYDGYLHDLLFEPEREQITQDIIKWMDHMLNVLMGKAI